MDFGHKKLYINGELTPAVGNTHFDLISPLNEKVVATLSWATIQDTLNTLNAAQKGFEFWSKLSVEERENWILKLRSKIIEKSDVLREMMMYEMGKSWNGTQEDMTSITNSLEFYAKEIKNKTDIPINDKEGTHTHKVIHQPIGVVVAFLAYNFPLLNLGFKLGPALAAGCSIILKPSEFSPLSAYMIGEICEEINFPKGVINVICGDVTEVGIPLCESTIPKLITMIGSTETAQKLIAQSSSTSIKRYSMECGGNAPFVVFPDADLDKAVTDGFDLKYGNAGQVCVAPNRFYVHDTIFDDFVEKFTQKVKTIKIGYGKDEENSSFMGPLANKQSLVKMDDIVKKAQEEGAKLLFGGERIAKEGFYYQPTVLLFKNNEANTLQKEIFGPVALITSFSSIEEAIALSNSTSVGLASYVYSSDEDTLHQFTEELEFGEVHLNGFKYDIYLPHGGIKNSGIGVDCSVFALDDYLIKKRVTKEL
ncbi:aldehyde dehydrogenase family protein [Aquimarina algicola]|uniref:Aldehyde dehydrogenase family protein n=1 Tax=Aquimarina algicola TaxID=2589995 RepID=A0A504J0Q2_9FLAO|nr:aldehyde dehydrogenase family protein [Aquimarina algicola]TPN84416.1 aldehyde dehydrogenase family protein [Aquimarina algicola]